MASEQVAHSSDDNGVDLTDAPGPKLVGGMKLPEFLGGTKNETPHYRKAAPKKAITQYKQAEALFQEKKYKQAEKEFARIVKHYNETSIEEDALFMMAESQFMRKRYSWAQDSYDELLDEFPSSRHLGKSTARLFTIARAWLHSPKMVTSKDVKQVNFNNPKGESILKKPKKRYFDPTRVIPILPNLHDRSRPVFDTDGRALQALKSIWLNDPTGKLADDALMLAASHHFRKENYLDAGRLLKIIREEYPKSPHLENAFEIGSVVSQMAYQGPAYDINPLLESQKLKRSSQQIFLASAGGASGERRRKELAKIAEAKAAHEWQNVLYWEKKGKPKSVAIYCQVMMDEHPHSKYAEMARKKLAIIRKQPQAKPWSFPKLRPIKFPNLIPVPQTKKQENETPARSSVVIEE